MSHFTVLVIGNDPKDQLARYDENLETEEQSREVTPEEKREFMEYYLRNHPESSSLSFEEMYNTYGDEWNVNGWRRNEEGILCYYSTYNQDAKWDWYQLGGRWAGMLKLKEGVSSLQPLGFSWGWPAEERAKKSEENVADAALKRDIDFEGMREDAAREAGERYDKLASHFGGTIPSFYTREQVREKFPQMSVDEMRDFYHAQEAVKTGKEKEHIWDMDDYAYTREEYVRSARSNACVTFALVKDGVWYEKGQMGWFGMAFNEKEESQWKEEFNRLLDSLPDDTLISVFDCHI